MGLKEYKRFKSIKQYEDITGCKIDDLKAIKVKNAELYDQLIELEGLYREALKRISMLENNYKTNATPTKLTEKEKKEIQDKYLNSLTPEKLVEQFAGEEEEFYVNGKPTNTDNA